MRKRRIDIIINFRLSIITNHDWILYFQSTFSFSQSTSSNQVLVQENRQGTNFCHRKIFWKSDMTLFFEKSFCEISLKKVVYNQTVPYKCVSVSPFVKGQEGSPSSSLIKLNFSKSNFSFWIEVQLTNSNRHLISKRRKKLEKKSHETNYSFLKISILRKETNPKNTYQLRM